MRAGTACQQVVYSVKGRGSAKRRVRVVVDWMSCTQSLRRVVPAGVMYRNYAAGARGRGCPQSKKEISMFPFWVVIPKKESDCGHPKF